MSDSTTSTRYLLYQPNHGTGMELHILQTAAQLAVATQRVLVIPRVPELETNKYQTGLDEHFKMDALCEWISHQEFLQRTGGVIDRLLHIVPSYRPEYLSQLNRDWHPIWIQNIDRYPYFGLVGCTIRQVTRLEVLAIYGRLELGPAFDFPEPTIAFSYINGLAEDEPEAIPEADDDFNGRRWVPREPVDGYFDQVDAWASHRPFQACHLREGYRQLALEVLGVTLPSVSDFLAELDPSSLTYVATDDETAFMKMEAAMSDVGRIKTDSPLAQVALDMSACISASRFVGTHFSTFSQYISHARRLRGHAAKSTVLLRDPAHSADHQYTNYPIGSQ